MLTGNNGSGKSTLLRCMATALKLHYGDIRIGGASLWANRHQLRRQIAYLSHQGALYDDLSGRDNLLTWARLGGFVPLVEPLLERVGLDASRHDPVKTYSAGMRRRLALARILIKRPKLVLFDEPYSALDPGGRDLVTEVANDLRNQGATLVLATHLPSSAVACCERRIHLESGLMVFNGDATADSVPA